MKQISKTEANKMMKAAGVPTSVINYIAKRQTTYYREETEMFIATCERSANA